MAVKMMGGGSSADRALRRIRHLGKEEYLLPCRLYHLIHVRPVVLGLPPAPFSEELAREV